MPGTNYSHIVAEIQGLSLSEQLRLLEEMAAMVRRKAGVEYTPRSILELKGKGKDIWRDMDVKTYLERERSSWSG